MNTMTKRDTRDYILQVVLWAGLAAVLLAVFGFSSCSIDKSNVTPAQAVTLEQLEHEQAAAEASGDPVAKAAADAKLDEFEDAVMKERAGPLLGALSAVPGIGPMTMLLSPLILAGLPLLSKRGRKHLGDAVKGVAPIGSSVAKAYGMKHSEDPAPDPAPTSNG